MEAVALADRLDKIGTKRGNRLTEKAWDRAVYRMGIYNEIAQQVAEPDLEKLGFCLKCGTRPCTCEEKYGEEKAG